MGGGVGAAAGVVSSQSAPVLVSAGCARCGGAVSWLRVQAVYILVPASRMSTGRGMLPSYLGLCWFNLMCVWVNLLPFARRPSAGAGED